MSIEKASHGDTSDQHNQASQALSQEANDHSSLITRVGREIDLTTTGLFGGLKDGVSDLMHNPAQALLDVAAPVAFTLAFKNAGAARLPLELIGGASMVGFGYQAYKGIDASLPAFKDAWNSGANFGADRDTVEKNLGPIALNGAIMGAVGLGMSKALDRLNWEAPTKAELPSSDEDFDAQKQTSIPNFSIVSDSVGRGGQLSSLDHAQELKDLGYDTILDLRLPGLATFRERLWANKLGLNYENRPLILPTAARMGSIMDLVNDEATGKTYVHCRFGSDRTGTVIGAVRRQSGWGTQDTYDEMLNFGFKPALVNMKNYVFSVKPQI